MCRAHEPFGDVWDPFYAHPCPAGGRTLVAERSRWYPLLAAQEGPTGTWSLVDAYDRVYGTIELRRSAGGGSGQIFSSFRDSRSLRESFFIKISGLKG